MQRPATLEEAVERYAAEAARISARVFAQNAIKGDLADLVERRVDRLARVMKEAARAEILRELRRYRADPSAFADPPKPPLEFSTDGEHQSHG